MITLRDYLLLADVVLPALELYRTIPRDRDEDIAVFLCHGVQITQVPASLVGQRYTPEHRRRWSCPVCQRALTLAERHTAIEHLFANGNLLAAFEAIRLHGIASGWYNPDWPLTEEQMQRALALRGNVDFALN